MRKLLIVLSLLIFPIVAAVPVAAQTDVLDPVCADTPAAPICQGDAQNDPVAGSNGVIMRVVNILSWVTGAAALIVGIYGGLKYVLSNGDSSAVTTARNSILYAVIGVVIFATSRVIIEFVIGQV